MRQTYTKHISLFFNVLLITSFLFKFTGTNAASLKGTVIDANTKEQIIGAVIRINELNISTATNLEGIYLFKNLAAGDYTLECKFLGLKTMTQKVSITSGGPDVHLDFKMESEDAIMQVNVVGKLNNETDVSARNSEQKADYAQNILSSQSILLLPDITIANSLQRISGVNVQRNSTGDGKYAVVRGMEKRYNYTTINSVKIATPDNKNRYIPLDLFPNDIVERLEVIKSLLPSMEADAIGGVINLQLRTAPDYLMVRATVSAGYSEIFADNPFQTYNANAINPKSPEQIHGPDYLASLTTDFPKADHDYTSINNPINTTANVILGNRFLKDHKLGILFVGSYQNIFRGSREDFFEPSNKPTADQVPGTPNIYQNLRGDAPQFDYMDIRRYYTQETRYAAHLNVDYRFNELNSINFYSVYVRSAQQQVRIGSDSVLDIQRTGIGSGNVENEYRSILTLQSIYNATLQGKHILFDGFKLDWTVAYDLAANDQPDYSTFTTLAQANRSNTGVESTTLWTVESLSSKWISNTDQDEQAFLNLTYDRNLFGNEFEIQGGGMARHKTRDNYEIEYSITPSIPNGQQTELYTTYDNTQFSWIPSGAAAGNLVNTNNYTLEEDITAGYIQAKYMFFGRLQVLAGFRAEATDESYIETYEPNTFVGQTGSKSYYDILPGIHLKYILDSKQNLRFSYYESLTRPSFYEITPYSLPGDYFTEQGNPYLKHTTADNYDLRYEWFPGGIDEVLVGAFYKNIYNPIEFGLVATGTSAQAIEPENFGIATNYGAEAQIVKYFGVFGISANYTYTNSQITTAKDLYYRTPPNSSGNTSLATISVDETRPLQGQAANIGNLSLIYKDTKQGLSAQVAFVYTGRNIAYVSAYYGLDYWQRANWQLDFSAEKTISRNFSIYVKLTNLLNTPTILEIEQTNTFQPAWVQSHLNTPGLSQTERSFLLNSVLPDQDRSSAITVQKSYYDPSYLIGLRYKF